MDQGSQGVSAELAEYDVVVVGAGPGGSNAAKVALSNGLSVAQFDAQGFPRRKPCGGGMTIKACKALEFDMAPVTRGEFQTVQFNVFERRINQFTNRSAVVMRMVEREHFDHWLVEQNRQSDSFSFFENEKVLQVEFADGRFVVGTAQRKVRSRFLVGADGAYSIVNKKFGITTPKGFAVAVEIVIPRDQATLNPETPPCFDFGAVESGYGWVFPKDDHWNVGIYSVKKSTTLKEDLARYVSAKGFTLRSNPFSSFVGHQFPYGGFKVRVPEAPVFLVGDAGGFGDPIMGEGIYHAIESGRIAGQSIVDCAQGSATHRDYYKRLRKSVLSDTFVTYIIGSEFYRSLNKAVTILENPLVWRPLMQGYGEGRNFTGIVKRGGLLLAQSFWRKSLGYQRTGASLPFSFTGPFRGLLFLCEPPIQKALRLLRFKS
jgi:menaquinone-9 beta-reductase